MNENNINNENELNYYESINQINNKIDSIIYFQEHSYSLSIITFAIFVVVFVLIILYKYIF